MKKSHQFILAVIIVASILIIAFAPDDVSLPPGELNQEITKCIGENSIIFTQLGCSACKAQEEIFGENFQYLEIVDCFFDKLVCIDEGIQATPTWEINGDYYRGIQSAETLRELTGC